MTIPRWISRKSSQPNSHRSRLCLERLEDRCVPSTVTNLNDSGPGSLRDALANTPTGGRVDFQTGLSGTITLTTGTLAIAKDISVIGPGPDLITVSGNRAYQVFTIAPAVHVAIAGLTVADGVSPLFGGGIYNEGTLTITYSTLTANTTANRGGGVYNGPSGNLTINSSLLWGNSTANAGGAIYNLGSLTVVSSSLLANGSKDADGGAVFNLGKAAIQESTFSGNGGSDAFGGAIRNDGVLTADGSTFSANTAASGGAIYNVGTLTVSNSNFSSNTTALVLVTFVSVYTYEGNGGSIYNYAMLTVSNCTFSGDNAGNGGGIYNDGTLTVSGSTFKAEGPAMYGGGTGGGIDNNGSLTVTGSTFSSNTAALGAGIYNSASGTSMVSSSMFAGNAAGSQGSGIANDGMLTIADSTFSGNGGEYVQGCGLFNSGTVKISNSILSGNGAHSSQFIGGGMFSRGTVTIKNSTISGNGGGGIISGGVLTISDSTISDNYTIYDGGGISAGGTLTLNHCTISGNGAVAGGGIECGGTVTIDDCTISGNSAGGVEGGTAAIWGGGTLYLSNSTISGNRDFSGYATIGFSGTATIQNCTISGNRGCIQGTGIISNCVISGNSSLFGPGGLEGDWAITDCTISGNTGSSAGGIETGGMLTISNSTITGNRGGYDSGLFAGAGAIVIDRNDASVVLTNCTISGNTVPSDAPTQSQITVGFQAKLELRDTIVSGNGAIPNFLAGAGATIVSLGHNLSSDNGSGYLTGPGDLINIDPLLGALQDNGGPTFTMALLPGSPAIDAGDNTDAPPFDQRGPGFPRIVNGTIDIGAYEVQARPVPPPTARPFVLAWRPTSASVIDPVMGVGPAFADSETRAVLLADNFQSPSRSAADDVLESKHFRELAAIDDLIRYWIDLGRE